MPWRAQSRLKSQRWPSWTSCRYIQTNWAGESPLRYLPWSNWKSCESSLLFYLVLVRASQHFIFNECWPCAPPNTHFQEVMFLFQATYRQSIPKTPKLHLLRQSRFYLRLWWDTNSIRFIMLWGLQDSIPNIWADCSQFPVRLWWLNLQVCAHDYYNVWLLWLL